jgi:hypothetical protein
VSAKVIMTDQQSQTMSWVMKQGTWFFTLRPTNKPRNSTSSVETLFSVLGRGLPSADRQIAGTFPESVDAP